MTTRDQKTPDEAFGQNVALARGWKSLSQRELAQRLSAAGFKVDAPAVSRIEKGSRSVRLAEALIIADVLDIEISTLVSGLDGSPLADLKGIRRSATDAFHMLREPLRRFMQSYIWVYEHLVEYPELVDSFELEGERIVNAGDFFRVAAQRIAVLEREARAAGERDPEGSYAVFHDQVARDGIRAVVFAYVNALLKSQEEAFAELDAPSRREEVGDAETADTAE